MGVKPEHYPGVGHHRRLLIRGVLGDGATDEVLDAWGAAYGDLAAIFIGREKELYDSGPRLSGGWYGFKEFCVSRKVRESSTIVSFHLVPADGSTLPDFLPGQFLSVKLKTPQDPNEQIRQYSLSCASNGTYRFREADLSLQASMGTHELSTWAVDRKREGIACCRSVAGRWKHRRDPWLSAKSAS